MLTGANKQKQCHKSERMYLSVFAVGVYFFSTKHLIYLNVCRQLCRLHNKTTQADDVITWIKKNVFIFLH